MPLPNLTNMLQHAYRHIYAVGAFGVASWDIMKGVAVGDPGLDVGNEFTELIPGELNTGRPQLSSVRRIK